MKRNYLVDSKQRLHSNSKVDTGEGVLGVRLDPLQGKIRQEQKRTRGPYPAIGPGPHSAG